MTEFTVEMLEISKVKRYYAQQILEHLFYNITDYKTRAKPCLLSVNYRRKTAN